MWLKWLPWRFIVRKVAREQGFGDPISVLAQFQNFAQPSDVLAPKELLREGVVLHARGLMNSQAIQHNLDWVWPFWAERQFDPHDKSFIPRAFSLTQINLTHRNWTAVGVPGNDEFPIVDARGLLTPYYDGWSLDAWIITGGPHSLIPSRLAEIAQELAMNDNLAVVTRAESGPLSLRSRAEMLTQDDSYACRLTLSGLSTIAHEKSWLVVSLRPYNPEGVSFIHDIELLEQRRGWKVNGKSEIYFDKPADQYEFSYYRHGDVYSRLPSAEDKNTVYCKVGMATAAALFELRPGQAKDVVVTVPFRKKEQKSVLPQPDAASQWKDSLKPYCKLSIPDERFQFLYDAALRTVILHSPREVYPGPYTYRRFWFRDAAFILYAMLCAGLTERVKNVLDTFPPRQTKSGYFHSQDGEWDSNGEALWIIQKFCEMTRTPPGPQCLKTVDQGGLWISRKRLAKEPFSPHAGLLPAGFSAEHLGPNDYYYWDDFWGVAGLRAAGYLENLYGDKDRGRHFDREAGEFLESIRESLLQVQLRLRVKAMPASPYRRLDSGAIGSLAAGYPLKLFEAHDPRLMETVEYLLKNCFIDGGFFHDMTHSGINPYLSLHVAQVLLRAGDKRFFDVMRAIAGLASATGQWPEAIHPITKGGCMGDGQHVWAAAEWILMIRGCFVREEEAESKIVLCSGVPDDWLAAEKEISFGPALTTFGPVSLLIQPGRDKITVSWSGEWFAGAPLIELALPGFPKIRASGGETTLDIKRQERPCVS